MKFRRVANFASVSEAERIINCAYGASLQRFDRAEIFESGNSDCVLVAFHGSGYRYLRVEYVGKGNWVFVGGVLLFDQKNLSASLIEVRHSNQPHPPGRADSADDRVSVAAGDGIDLAVRGAERSTQLRSWHAHFAGVAPRNRCTTNSPAVVEQLPLPIGRCA